MALKKAREEIGALTPKAPTYRQENFYRFPDTGEGAAADPDLATPRVSTPKMSYAARAGGGRGLQPPPLGKIQERQGSMTVLGKPKPAPGGAAAAARPLLFQGSQLHSKLNEKKPTDDRTDSSQTLRQTQTQTQTPDALTNTDENTRTDVMTLITETLENFSKKFDDRLRALESKPAAPETEAIVDCVVDRINTQRAEQAAELSRRVTLMTDDVNVNPVTVLIGKMMQGMVDATMNKKPDTFLTLITKLYNDSHNKSQKAQVPRWDNDLQILGNLALGLGNADQEVQKDGK